MSAEPAASSFLVAGMDLSRDDGQWIVTAIDAVLARDAQQFASAVRSLARQPYEPVSGQPLAPEYLVATSWVSVACRKVLDDQFADSWQAFDSVNELIGRVAGLRPEFACSPEELGVFLLSLRAGALGGVPGGGLPTLPLEVLLGAGLVVLAWSTTVGVDAKALFA